MANGLDVEITLAGWTDEQRESLGFLLGDAGIRWRFQADAVVVPAIAAEEARRLVAYLGEGDDSEDEAVRPDGGLVYQSFEGTERVTIADTTPDDLFSFCFSDVEVPRAFVPRALVELGAVATIEHDAAGRSTTAVSLETRAGTLERVYEEIDRTRPHRLVARGSDSWGQVWRETWTFEPSGPDVVISLTFDVEVADQARTPDQFRSFRSDWFAQHIAAQRLGSLKTQYESGLTCGSTSELLP